MVSQRTALQEIELGLLRQTAEAIEKLHLRYWVTGGTLLGAVRHGGFIPWDDDVDIAMPRADYEQFIREGQKLLPDWCFLQTHRSEKEIWTGYAKARDSRTTFVEKGQIFKEINHGVYIDIFPIDGFPAAGIQQKKAWLQHEIYSLKLNRSHYSTGSSLKWRAASFFSNLLLADWEKTWQKRERLYTSCPFGTEGLIVNYNGAYRKKEIMQGSIFRETAELPFEDMTVRAPGGWQELLENLYGDYRKLPAEKDRVPQHDAFLIDPERPWREHEEDIRRIRNEITRSKHEQGRK